MKIEDLYERGSARVSQLEAQVREIEEALEELELLFLMFNKKDFGVLIGRSKRVYTESDIRAMRRRLHDILHNNVILSGRQGIGRIDKEEDTRLLVAKMGAATEIALTGALVGVTTAIGAAFGVGVIAGGVAGVAGAVNIANQADELRYYNAASRVLAIVDQLSKLQSPKKYNRGLLRRFTDKLLLKKPSHIEKDGQRFIKEKMRKMSIRMEKLFRGLPKYIPMEDENGEVKKYPSARLFMTNEHV